MKTYSFSFDFDDMSCCTKISVPVLSASSRIVVGMSGGVDSSVAALELVRQGYEVIGVTLRLWQSQCDVHATDTDVKDAEKIAKKLGIRHVLVDQTDAFFRDVITPFIDQYAMGQTPSPCAICNPSVKIPSLVQVAKQLEATHVATGHYARIIQHDCGNRVARAIDERKDQSYFLGGLSSSMLQHLVFPLGEYTKQQVRDRAQANQLSVAHRRESQDLCFVSNGNYGKFFELLAPDRVKRGWLIRADGTRLSPHAGIHQFTIGQRKGLGVALGDRAFVTRIDATSGSVVIGEEKDIFGKHLRVVSPVVAAGVSFPVRATVQVRYRDPGTEATIVQGQDGVIEVAFDEPVRAISAGQFAVGYIGDEVVISGRIVL